MESGSFEQRALPSGARGAILAATLIAFLQILVFYQIFQHPFAGFDDQEYLTDNPFVKAGLTWESLRWAFTTFHAANWHPLTWISHMLDVELFGLNPGPHHLVNLSFHGLNTLLLFLLLLRTTQKTWRSALVAGIFAIHPLHVESVVWIAERKDVLSTFFGLLAMQSYISYQDTHRGSQYLSLMGFFALSLMSKPMLVTLPFILLLLDLWPLERIRIIASTPKSLGIGNALMSFGQFLPEKIPLLVLSLVSSIVTYIAQSHHNATGLMEYYPLSIRLKNALVAYVSYLGKTVWPVGLSIFYPHPGPGIPLWKSLSAGLLLAAATFLVIRRMRTHPYLATGWFWFTGTLVPVIGIVQVGGQAMADRYTYFPGIGLFLLIAWGIPDLIPKGRYSQRIMTALGCFILAILSLKAWHQTGIWKTRAGLFRHSLSVTSGNFIMHNNLGIELAEQGKFQEAFFHYQEALRLKPNYSEAYYNWGADLEHLRFDFEAGTMYRKALLSNPDFLPAYLSLGRMMLRHGKPAEAEIYFREGLTRDPKNQVLRRELQQLISGK